MESQIAKKYYSLTGIKREEDGKRYESFIGWSFCRKLSCEKYLQGVKYSLKEEITALNNILNNQNIDLKEKDKILFDINDYESKLSDLKSSCTSSEKNNSDDINSKTSSGNSKYKEDSSDNNINNTNKNENIINNSINNDSTIVNLDINIYKIDNNNINNNSNINTNNIINNDINTNNVITNDINTNNIINNDINTNNIINNDINTNNIINNDININNVINNDININNNNQNKIYIRNDKPKKNKNSKKNKIRVNRDGDMHGDIDVVIPNVCKEKFDDMIKNNFYCDAQEGKCIILNKDILSKLPPNFHLFIEIGINVFDTHWPQKTKQIKKYVSLINIRNKIKNEKIKNLYIKDFEKRFSLHLNSKINNIAKSYVYMLISNSDYATFIRRFMDNKIFQGESAKEYQNICSIAPNELICCGYVDFEMEINSKAYLINQIKKQNQKIEELLIAVRKLQNQNNGKKTNKKKEKNSNGENSEDST